MKVNELGSMDRRRFVKTGSGLLVAVGFGACHASGEIWGIDLAEYARLMIYFARSRQKAGEIMPARANYLTRFLTRRGVP